MTIPFERTRSVVQAKDFLERLLDPKQSPRVPRWVRGHAKMVLRHYPTYADIEAAHTALPHVFGPVPPFSRMRAGPQVQAAIDASTSQPEGSGID